MHPYQKHREDKTSRSRVKHVLKADGGPIKDQSRYGDEGMKEGNDNELRARMLLGPPRTKNTPGFDTETSSTRRKRG